LEQLNIPVSTAYWWMDRYEVSIGKKPGRATEPKEPEPFHPLNAMGDLRSLVDKTIQSWPPEGKRFAPMALRDLADVLDLEERRMRRDAICFCWRWRNTFERMLSERLAGCDDPNLEVDYAELARAAILQVTEEPWHCDKEAG
jgi:hypothetical protein